MKNLENKQDFTQKFNKIFIFHDSCEAASIYKNYDKDEKNNLNMYVMASSKAK